MTDTPETEAEPEAAPEPEQTGADMLYGVPTREAFGQRTLYPSIDEYEALFDELIEEGFVTAVDLCAVDYLHHERVDLPASITPERFEVVVNLLSHVRRERIRVRLQVADGVPVPTLFDRFPGTDAMEREAFDMFGINFQDHPDLSRILMPETWKGHPLRKDYDIGAIPVQFKAAPG